METTHLIKDLIHVGLQKPKTTRASERTGWSPQFDDYEPSLVLAKLACESFVAAMEVDCDPYWLTLTGVTGCGKTYLLRQVFREAKRINPGNPANTPIWPPDWETNGARSHDASRPGCFLYDEGGFASRMRNGAYDLPRAHYDDFFVGFDEVGVTRDPTNFISEAVGTLCDVRLRRWTMFCTNLSLQEISERMDARIASRMIRSGNKVIEINAGDYALRA